MTALSNYAENKAIEHLTGTTTWTKPTNTYVQLHTASPGEDCTTAVAATTTRQQASWAAAASRAIATNAALNWTIASNETISHFSIWDASTAGNPIAYGAFSASVVEQTNDTFTVASGGLTLDFTTITSAISTYAANALLEHMTGKTSWTKPTTVYVQLHTGAPGLAGTSNVAATSTRTTSGGFGAGSNGTVLNSANIDFTAAANETITHFSLFDASTAGNNLWGDAVTASKAILTGQTVRFGAGVLSLTLA
jgi:hypothetical protein